MRGVTTGLAEQNFLGQQSFPPGSEQSFSIKISRMDRPQAHRDVIRDIFRATDLAHSRAASKRTGSTIALRH